MNSTEPWDTKCLDWQERLVAGRSLIPQLPLYEEEARRGLSVFKRLKLPDVIGNPSFGSVAGSWVFDFVEAVFGSYDEVEAKRRILEFFLLVAKKNGKSTLAAGIMVTAIWVNRRPDAEFMFLAPTLEVAGISFRQARGIINLDPVLKKTFHIQDNIRRISHRDTGAFLQIKAADLDVVTGSKPLGTLIDETHVFSTHSKAVDVFLEVRGSLAARPDGFLLQISTQSKAPPAGVFRSELQRARDVRDGRLTGLPKPLLPVLYELPDKLRDQWEDPRYWKLSNPNLGRSVDEDFLRSSLIDAKRKGPSDLALFASQHFNVEIGQLLRGDRWAGAEFWMKQTDETLTLETLIERSECVVVGIDGGGLDDTLGLCTLGRSRADPQRWLCWSHAWCHEGVLQRRQTIAATLQDFANAGELTIVQDELDDVPQIIEIVKYIKDKNMLAAVAVDPAGIGELVDALAAIQITPENKKIIGAPQGYGMMNAIKTAERKLANGTLFHSRSDLMNWYVANLKVEPTATAIRMTKQNAGDLKIDGAMALFDAVTVMQTAPAKAPEYQMFFV